MSPRAFLVEPRQTFGNNPLRETQERGLSIEYAVEPLWNTIFICMYGVSETEGVVFREDSPDGTHPLLWEGSRSISTGLLDRLLTLLRQNGFATMEHYYLSSEIIDATCLHLMARLERGGPLRHVYIETPDDRENPRASRFFTALKRLIWYNEAEFIRRSAEAPGWAERLWRWFTR